MSPRVGARPKALTPSEHELEEARLLAEPARGVAVQRIGRRIEEFRDRWPQLVGQPGVARLNRATGEVVKPEGGRCAACQRFLHPSSGLIRDDKGYCAQCRGEIWRMVGQRVGVYP